MTENSGVRKALNSVSGFVSEFVEDALEGLGMAGKWVLAKPVRACVAAGVLLLLLGPSCHIRVHIDSTPSEVSNVR